MRWRRCWFFSEEANIERRRPYTSKLNGRRRSHSLNHSRHQNMSARFRTVTSVPFLPTFNFNNSSKTSPQMIGEQVSPGPAFRKSRYICNFIQFQKSSKCLLKYEEALIGPSNSLLDSSNLPMGLNTFDYFFKKNTV